MRAAASRGELDRLVIDPALAAGELVQPLRHQVEALVVDKRGWVRLERRVRKHQRDNVIELVDF